MALLVGLLTPGLRAQNAGGDSPPARHVLLIFSESRDLPGNVMMEQGVQEELSKTVTNPIEFFTESLDVGRFSNPRHYQLFRDFIKNKYESQKLDLVMIFMARDFLLAQELPSAMLSNVPTLFVVGHDLGLPPPAAGPPMTGIMQRFDVTGTMKFIIRLQPETHHVVVVGGTSVADQTILERIAATARSMDGVDFEFWTNRPIAEVYHAAAALAPGTVILLSSVQTDVTGAALYTSQVVRSLAPVAAVPVYVMGAGLIGGGAVGGNVVDYHDLGLSAGRLAARALAGTPVTRMPVEYRSNSVPMVDWRTLQRWHISASRLPLHTVVRYQPVTLWGTYWKLIVLIGAGLLAQAVTIAALLIQRRRQRRAEAEILRQRAELAHVSRVSMMGQLASALTHELNQPLGAILRNAEAAEIFLQGERPNLEEVRAILTDIRRDDKRAGNVIDHMRSLFKRQRLATGTLDLKDMIEDTIAMARPDAAARQVRLKVEVPPHLPPAQGDRVHIQQVLLNLILNGMDAMNSIPKPRRALVVTAAATSHGNLRVTVTDNGTGIAPDEAGHVFEPFFTTKPHGMGMGLAISRTIIEAHGGDIWMKSLAAEGTTFTFLLPPAGADKLTPGDLPAMG